MRNSISFPHCFTHSSRAVCKRREEGLLCETQFHFRIASVEPEYEIHSGSMGRCLREALVQARKHRLPSAPPPADHRMAQSFVLIVLASDAFDHP